MFRAFQRGVRRVRHFNRTLREQGVGPLSRLILVLQKVKQRSFPTGSRRLRFYRAAIGRISEPVLRYAYRNWKVNAERRHPDLEEEAQTSFAEIEVLRFPEQEQPLVSILIPVYEQWRVTYGCLRSILRYSGNRIPYEVLILDDNSQDEIQQLPEKTSGVRYVRNPENLRFLKNCNHGATHARGKHLLLLNNDTLVHEGWLEAMVERVESDPEIGLVAAKLLGDDGILQEAGGIIFQDGSGWNYGRGQDPNHPAFQFFKDCDFGSGACILVPRAIWEQVGGFDERFAPAYYEDADLAFAIRAAGYRTVYEPRAVVTHLEGVSHGTDVTTGLKRYQVENQVKFRDKWKETLEAEQCAGPEDLDRAQCRGAHRPCVLIADYQIPQWTNEAGLRLTWMYIQLFQELGYRVLFRPANLFPVEPFTSIMQAQGVEVLHGQEYLDMDGWLRDHGKAIDYAYLSRWEVADPLMAPLRRHTDAKIVFQVVDLHYLREQRRWSNAGKSGDSPEAVRQKGIEFRLVEASDAVHTPSTFESALLQAEFPHKRIADVPIFFYEALPEPQLHHGGKNLLFVGGYGHPPNEDAILWFAKEILPGILAKHPDVRVHLVGGGAGSAVQALAGEHVKLHGRVDDDALEEAYRTSDIAVVPLRFGAGVKGKAVEAMAKGLPVVTTPIGAEGIPEHGCPLVVGETAEELGNRIVALLDDYEARGALAAQGQAFIRENYSRGRAVDILRTDFAPGPAAGALEKHDPEA